MQGNLHPSPIDQATRFGRLITNVYRQWRRQIDFAFKELDLSEATRMPIIVLHDHGESMRQKELAEALALDSSSLFRVLNTLREKGFVTWEPDPTDRRAKRIALTQTGRDIARQIYERSLAIEHHVMSDLDAGNLAVTRAVLEETLVRLQKLKA
jgi:MarR family transcriptional regulator for hemolysin